MSKRSTLASHQEILIREFIQALADEIEAIKKGRGGSVVTVYDGMFLRREGPSLYTSLQLRVLS